jgi:hypothetical protein
MGRSTRPVFVSVLAVLVSPSVETPVANRRVHGDRFLYHWLCVIQSVRTWAGWERPHPGPSCVSPARCGCR